MLIKIDYKQLNKVLLAYVIHIVYHKAERVREKICFEYENSCSEGSYMLS